MLQTRCSSSFREIWIERLRRRGPFRNRSFYLSPAATPHLYSFGGTHEWIFFSLPPLFRCTSLQPTPVFVVAYNRTTAAIFIFFFFFPLRANTFRPLKAPSLETALQQYFWQYSFPPDFCQHIFRVSKWNKLEKLGKKSFSVLMDKLPIFSVPNKNSLKTLFLFNFIWPKYRVKIILII